jgi:hypothetical protein
MYALRYDVRRSTAEAEAGQICLCTFRYGYGRHFCAGEHVRRERLQYMVAELAHGRLGFMKPYFACQLVIEQISPGFLAEKYTEIRCGIYYLDDDIELVAHAPHVIRERLERVDVAVRADAYDVYAMVVLELCRAVVAASQERHVVPVGHQSY